MDQIKFTQSFISFVESYIGEKEDEGVNRSALIDAINKWFGLPMGMPYCISALLWCLDQYCKENGISTSLPKRASVVGFFHCVPESLIHDTPEDGDIVCWEFGNKGIGHAGLVTEVIDKDTMRTVEFNTSDGKGINRDGDGCYERIRSRHVSDSFKILGYVRIKDSVFS